MLESKISVWYHERKTIFLLLLIPALVVSVFITLASRPVAKTPSLLFFEVEPGEGFREIVNSLKNENLIRSEAAFKVLAVLTGSASEFKPGGYELSPHLSSFQIIRSLVGGAKEVTVTIPEGLSASEVDKILSEKKVVTPGTFVDFVRKNSLEGKIFPDTYKFFIGSETKTVTSVFLRNFEVKVAPLLNQKPADFQTNLVIASLIEEEIPDPHDQRLVAGILIKRLKAGMPLQVDATICYAKRVKSPERGVSCHPLTALDMKIDSTYNTYLYKGLPPGPISSPGVSAILATLNQESSPYWFYLSDPKTGKTVFSRNLEEHNRNISLYILD